MMRIAAIGDNCIDAYPALQKYFPGGNAVNVAVYLRRYQVESAYVGAVGRDAYGRLLKESLSKQGVDISHLHELDGSTAVTYVELVNNDRQLGDYEEGVLASFTLSEDDLSFIAGYDMVHAGIWGKVEQHFPWFRARGLITSFDFADKLDHPLVEQVLPAIDYPFFSYHQDDAYIRSCMQHAHQQGAKVVVTTLGERGSLAYDGERFYTCGIKQVQVVDSLGAGDSFIAGFLYGVGSGYPIERCLELGTEGAAITIAYFGAW
nr:fructoselysine 6-kinase [Thermosporothrix hazakensis]